ncbi:OsmC family peroxiredoxin [Litorivita pollutaquae]|uniref:OsmC family peroxiredoxin n=1 Tax=Litorivita pollutaquae TaxID=2200892 RepID=A0A2V4MW93_9RHOB|nr:OsmC family protein [Litorivita pollutaquae]PYC48578.1 OsmC family peroxiredoxin [Litorivita pollutaquae]
MIKKSGSAVWQGSLKEGKGTVSTESGALDAQPYGFNTRFEDGVGTNPEELVGAAHASCFSMALSLGLGEAGITAASIKTTSTIYLDKEDGGFAVQKAHLETVIDAPDADEAEVLKFAEAAKKNCPISKLLAVDITMAASVA